MHMRTKALLAGLVFVAASAPMANAMTVAAWDQSGQPGDQAFTPPSASAANVTGSNMTRGAGLGPNAGPNSLNSNGWNTTAASPAADNDYIAFGFTVDPGFSVDLDELIIATRSSATGPGTVGLYSSLDSFTTAITSLVQPGGPFVNSVIDLSGLASVTGSVEFRLIEIGNTQADGSGTTGALGTLRVADYLSGGTYTDSQFTGTVTAVPIPAALPLLASALAGLGAIGWRKRKAG